MTIEKLEKLVKEKSEELSAEDLQARIEYAKYLLNNDESKEEILKALSPPESEVKIVLTKSEFYKYLAEYMKEDATKRDIRFMSPWGESKVPYDIEAFKGWKEFTEKLWEKCERIK